MGQAGIFESLLLLTPLRSRASLLPLRATFFDCSAWSRVCMYVLQSRKAFHMHEDTGEHVSRNSIQAREPNV